MDIWSLGVLTFEILTGRTPFSKNSPSQSMKTKQILSVKIYLFLG
jgi:serine/threonine protein kinase